MTLTTPYSLDYHTRQFETPYRSTIALKSFLSRHINPSEIRKVLDVACGAGANMYHLSELFPEASWTGVDIDAEALGVGREIMVGLGFHPLLVQRNLFTLTRSEHVFDVIPEPQFKVFREFDIVFLLQTLSWLPTYEDAMMQLLAVAKPGGTVIISSLFADDLIDATTVVQQYSDDGLFTPLLGDGLNYNVYCYARFVSVCRELGASKIEAEDFVIDADLPRPATRQLGTFTRTLADGTRLQQTGPLFLPWKFIAITK